MKIPFEAQSKDKRILLDLSKELLEAATSAAEKLGCNRMAFVRSSFAQFVEHGKKSRVKKIKSKFEGFKQEAKLSLRLPPSLHAAISETAKLNDLGLYEAMRLAIEEAL